MKFILIVCLTVALSGCTNPEEKMNKLITNALTACKAAEGPFYEVDVIGGSKDKILKDACDSPIEGLVIIEGLSSKATVGPYEITGGLDDELGVWVLTGVKWNDLDKAIRTTGDDAEKGAREQGLAMWEKAQTALPDSRWIREQRFDNVLKLRAKTRGKDKNPVGLGAAQSVYEEMAQWGAEKDKEFEQYLYVTVVKYHRDQAEKLELSLENIGGQDEWLESLIKQARKDGNKEDEQKYQKELDDSLAGRDAQIDEVNNRISAATKHACGEVGKINGANIENKQLKALATTARTGLDC